MKTKVSSNGVGTKEHVIRGEKLAEKWRNLERAGYSGGFAVTFMNAFRTEYIEPLKGKDLTSEEIKTLMHFLELSDTSITCFAQGLAELGSSEELGGGGLKGCGYFIAEIANILRELSWIHYDIAFLLKGRLDSLPDGEEVGHE